MLWFRVISEKTNIFNLVSQGGRGVGCVYPHKYSNVYFGLKDVLKCLIFLTNPFNLLTKNENK